ncbi:MAG: PEP-CTERM sorting domain-containing protein [Phycisphaeraceae bacterium]|nr:PEP-CTERM sorting domain-containing protein [Phycisphaerales bacterium]MCB9858959.1 PEP-CTERM sorting domain-containing protein [Phycisphaeraceae bacterium]
MKPITTLVAVACATQTSFAQPMLNMPSGLSVTSQNPSVTFPVYVSFDSNIYYAAGAIETTIYADHGIIEVTGAGMMDPQYLVTSSFGTSAEVVSGQQHFPSAGLFANTANPIAMFDVTYTVTNLSLPAGSLIDFTTDTTVLWMFTSPTLPSAVNLGSNINELAGVVIYNIPAPNTLAAFGLGSLVLVRRRR